MVTNFTNDTMLDTYVYTDEDRQVLRIMEKKLHNIQIKSKLQILRKDLASLDGEEWLTDTIIEAFLTSFVDKEKLYVLSSIQASAIAEKGVTLTAIRKDLSTFDFIAGPVHINKNHWALIFVAMKTQTVLYIDSRGENSTTRNKVLSNWITFCKKRDVMNKTKWIAGSYDHLVQVTTDNSNCGVFVCYFFNQLMQQNMAMLNNPFDIHYYRATIKSVIEFNSRVNKKFATS